MILVFGIPGLVIFFIFGIVAWVMGNAGLREMAGGLMDRSGEGLTKAGKICGIIATILAIVGIGIILVILVVAGIAAAVSAGG